MILITRPLEQTENLERLLRGVDIDYALFPVFEIKKLISKL